MLSNAFARLRRFSSWRYVIALLLSVSLHFLLITGASWHFPVTDIDDDTIEVALVPQQLAEKPAVKPPVPKQLAVKPETLDNGVPQPTPTIETAAENKSADQAAGNALDTTKQAESTVEDASTEVLPEEISQQEPLNEASTWIPKSSFLEMDYDVFRGIGGMKIGVTRINYKSGADGKYYLKSETEAKGFAALILSDTLVQVSEGLVTDKGLQPAEFSYQFARKSRQARFDWQSGLLTQQANKEETTVQLPAGTQDILSFMFQFMFVPPLQQMELNITNGRKLNHYSYGFEGEETISSKLGDIRTLHISRTGQEDAKDDLWLALDKLGTDKEYLPIKIRKTEKDGSVIEQVVTRINTNKSE